MNWNELTSEKQLEEIKQLSEQQPVMLFKHSTRCSISATALSRLERNWDEEEMSDVQSYYLDLIRYRPLSSQIASDYRIAHESPQILLIHRGNCVYTTSHLDISYAQLKMQLDRLKNAAQKQ